MEIPIGVEVIILTGKGLQQFLTSQNLDLLANPNSRKQELMAAVQKTMIPEHIFGLVENEPAKELITS